MLVPKLRFRDEQGQNYPEWQQKQIADIIKFVRNGFPYKWDLSRNHPYKVTRIESISKGVINTQKLGSVEKIDLKYKLNDGDILFSHINSLPYIGNTAIYHNNLGEIYHGMNLLNIRVNENVLSSFLQYELKTVSFLNIIKRNAQQAVNQCSISTTAIKKLPIKVPSLPEQKKIADFLSTYDQMIDVQSQRVEAMKTRKKGLLQKIFSQEIRFKDDQGHEYPEWDKKKIEDLCYMKGRIGWQGLKAKDFIDNGPYCVTGTDFYGGRVNWKTCYHVSEQRYEMDTNIQLRDGDLLITKDGTIGKLAYIEKLPGKACLNSHLLVIRPSGKKLINQFLYQVFSSELFVKYYLRAGSGSTMKSLSQSVIGKFMCPIPSLSEQQKIADFLTAVDTQIEVEEKRLETIKTIKKGLLQQMFI